MPAHSDLIQAIELAIRLATKACEDVRVLAREGLRPGPPGLGFDDMSCDFDGERVLTLKFSRGEQNKEFKFRLDIPLDRGVHQDGRQYEKSDFVTFGGRTFIAQIDTAAKPDVTSKDWRLMANKGRDGKDGVMRQPPGPVKLG